MSAETKRERSRNCPSVTLEAAIESAKRLYAQAGKSRIKAEVAANALGYAGLNGTALGALGALNQYGLMIREKGSMVSVSSDAIRVIHPMDDEQRVETLRILALNPAVFRELYDGGFQNGTEELICNHLIQNGFTPDKARKSASVFKSNIELANLCGDSIILKRVEPTEPEPFGKISTRMLSGTVTGGSTLTEKPSVQTDDKKGKTVLAQYSIPIGSNEATITFTGEKLSVEDFAALADYVQIFKKQFERKQKAESSSSIPQKPTFPDPPFVALWKGKNFEKMVKIVGQPVWEKGEWIYQDEGGALVPAKELFPNLKQ